MLASGDRLAGEGRQHGSRVFPVIDRHPVGPAEIGFHLGRQIAREGSDVGQLGGAFRYCCLLTSGS